MMPCEARIQVVHDCPYSRLTRSFPEATIAIWCNSNSHVVEIRALDPDMVKKVEEAIRAFGSRHSILREENLVRLISKDCDCGPGVTDLMDAENVWHIDPTIYSEGWENYHLVAHKKESIASLVEKIKAEGGTVNLVSLKPLRMQGWASEIIIPSSTILAGLTEKQAKVLVEACHHGYFDEPAKIDLDTLAKASGLSRSTYAEHLRKAEAKLLGNVTPLIQMASERPA